MRLLSLASYTFVITAQADEGYKKELSSRREQAPRFLCNLSRNGQAGSRPADQAWGSNL